MCKFPLYLRRFSGSNAPRFFVFMVAVEENYQVLCQMDCVVSYLLQTARSKDQMEILLVRNVWFWPAEAAQNVVTIGIHGSSAGSGVARQHWIKTRERAQGLPAKMRYRDGQRLKPGKVFMLMMLSHFRDFASQTCGKFSQPREIFADVCSRCEALDFRSHEPTAFQGRKDGFIQREFQFLNGHRTLKHARNHVRIRVEKGSNRLADGFIRFHTHGYKQIIGFRGLLPCCLDRHYDTFFL
jgi:hypothetical protein